MIGRFSNAQPAMVTGLFHNDLYVSPNGTPYFCGAVRSDGLAGIIDPASSFTILRDLHHDFRNKCGMHKNHYTESEGLSLRNVHQIGSSSFSSSVSPLFFFMMFPFLVVLRCFHFFASFPASPFKSTRSPPHRPIHLRSPIRPFPIESSIQRRHPTAIPTLDNLVGCTGWVDVEIDGLGCRSSRHHPRLCLPLWCLLFVASTHHQHHPRLRLPLWCLLFVASTHHQHFPFAENGFCLLPLSLVYHSWPLPLIKVLPLLSSPSDHHLVSLHFLAHSQDNPILPSLLRCSRYHRSPSPPALVSSSSPISMSASQWMLHLMTARQPRIERHAFSMWFVGSRRWEKLAFSEGSRYP